MWTLVLVMMLGQARAQQCIDRDSDGVCAPTDCNDADPGLEDTDSDGILDGDEVVTGTDPLVAEAPP